MEDLLERRISEIENCRYSEVMKMPELTSEK
jgi:hypothetical protein